MQSELASECLSPAIVKQEGIKIPFDAWWPFGGLNRGAYRVIYCDPPWKFSSGPSRNPRNHYACMSIKDIAALPVKELAHPKGSRLLMWTTLPMLQHSFRVLADWGFRYSTSRVWVKTLDAKDKPYRKSGYLAQEDFARGTGYEVIGNPEMLLIGKAGKPQRLGNEKPFSLIFGDRREHSRKPDAIREEIVKFFDGPRCELFARSPAPGFDVWGNETDKFAEAA